MPQETFYDYVSSNQDVISILAKLDALKEYKYVLTDIHGNKVIQAFTTDGSGNFTIAKDDLPDGYLAIGKFTLEVFESLNSDAIAIDFGGETEYKKIQIRIENTTGISKTTVGNAGSSSSGGGSGSGIPTIDAGTGGVADPAPSGRFYTITLHNVRSTTMSFYFDKKASVNWGDGSPVKQYPGDHIVNKVYNNVGDGPIEIKVYWEVEALNPCTVIYVQSGGSTANTAIIDSFTGDLPTNLWRFTVSNGLPEIPFDLLPDSTKYFSLRHCSLSLAELDELIVWCNDNGLSNGFINVMSQTTGATPTQNQNYTDLEFKNWTIYND